VERAACFTEDTDFLFQHEEQQKMALEYHEDRAALPPKATEQHRAIASLIEELEAVAWYHQRAAVSDDDELRAVIEHNRDEEIEHASMLFEWLRRNFPGFDEKMRIYLFQDKPILQFEEEAEESEEGGEQPGQGAATGRGTLGIGSMKGTPS
jgi:hypothetical protein